MTKKLAKKGNKGFTLVEILIVIAIIGILALAIVPNASKSIERSKVTSLISDYRTIKSAALTYFSDMDEWPEDGAGKVGFVTAPDGASGKWMGPYIEKWPESNEWNGEIIYNCKEGTLFGTDYVEERYLTLTKIPKSVYNRLVEELGSDFVVKDDDTDTTVHLLISRD